MSELEHSEKLDQLLPALIACQAAIQPAKKGSENPHFRSRYADLSDITEACREPLRANGFTVTYPMRPNAAGGNDVSCVLWHTSGQWMRSTLAMAGDLKNPQAVGSCITYYRRYLLAALLAIPTADDDAEAANGRGGQRERQHQGNPRDGRQQHGRTQGQERHRDQDRQAINRQFQPQNGSGGREERKPWDFYATSLCDEANVAWLRELDELGIDGKLRNDYRVLVNKFQLTNHLCTHAIEKGLIDEAQVSRPGTNGKGFVRDDSRAWAEVDKLFRRVGKKMFHHAQEYIEAKRNEARADIRNAEAMAN